jgi:acyl-CoA synthetase (AMP-forming)/AMP-acid ligase II
MRTPMAVVLVAAFTAGMVLVPMSAEAGMPAGMPGEERFEAWLSQLLEDANAQVQSELLKDPTTADLVTEANARSQEEAPRDEKFETELAASLKQADEQLKDELSRDPTGAGRTR